MVLEFSYVFSYLYWYYPHQIPVNVEGNILKWFAKNLAEKSGGWFIGVFTLLPNSMEYKKKLQIHWFKSF